MTPPDIIDTLAGLAPNSPLAAIRDRKPVTRQYAQASYQALFEPADLGNATVQERFALATFVAGLHGEDKIAAFYSARLSPTLAAALAAETARARTTGPYGAYPKGRLSAEDAPGPTYKVGVRLDARLSVALAHAHMLVFHPRDASARALQTLLDAGWSNAGIVTLSQLVAFLAFQIRAAAGLRTLAETPA